MVPQVRAGCLPHVRYSPESMLAAAGGLADGGQKPPEGRACQALVVTTFLVGVCSFSLGASCDAHPRDRRIGLRRTRPGRRTGQGGTLRAGGYAAAGGCISS